MSARGTAVWGAFVLTAVLAGGCSSQRALHMVERSGDRATSLGQHDLAVADYRELVERAPSVASYRLKYGRALLVAGEPHAAREQLEKAYTLMPRNDEVIDLLADAMAQSRDTDNAVRLLRTIAEDRKQPEDWMRLGRFLQRINDPDAAEAAFLTAARIDQGVSFEPQWELANLYRSVGAEQKALERLRMCLYLQPSNEQVQQLIRGFGEVPGPTAALRPTEQYSVPPQ